MNSKYFPKFDRPLIQYLFFQAIAGATIPVLFLISGLRGPEMAPNESLATLPIAAVVIGLALASPMAARSMKKLGRIQAHILGLFLTLVGIVIAIFGLGRNQFYVYSLGCLVSGAGCSFNNQVRFTAAESVPLEARSLVHSWVLMASLFAALLGPGLVRFGKDSLQVAEYAGSLGLLGILLFVLALSLWPLMATSKPSVTPSEHTNSQLILVVLRNKTFWLSALSGIASFSTMSLVMSATPMQMHHHDHFSHSDTTLTIQSHIMAMYLPSLFGGLIVAWLGVRKLIALGIAIFAACILIAYQQSGFQHYFWALVLLGVGWNFLFLASSTLISNSFTGPERFAAQGANDTIVYSIQATASLSAGMILTQFGWQTLLLIPVPVLILLSVLVARNALSLRVHN